MRYLLGWRPPPMLTMPLATALWVVAVSRRPKCGERPGSMPPDDHNVAVAERFDLPRHVDRRVVFHLPRPAPPDAQSSEVHQPDRSDGAGRSLPGSPCGGGHHDRMAGQTGRPRWARPLDRVVPIPTRRRQIMA